MLKDTPVVSNSRTHTKKERLLLVIVKEREFTRVVSRCSSLMIILDGKSVVKIPTAGPLWRVLIPLEFS